MWGLNVLASWSRERASFLLQHFYNKVQPAMQVFSEFNQDRPV